MENKLITLQAEMMKKMYEAGRGVGKRDLSEKSFSELLEILREDIEWSKGYGFYENA